jgi:hypothetical protein
MVDNLSANDDWDKGGDKLLLGELFGVNVGVGLALGVSSLFVRCESPNSDKLTAGTPGFSVSGIGGFPELSLGLGGS